MKIKEISASTRVDLQFKNKIFEQAELSLKKINDKKNATSSATSLEESTKADVMLKSARPNANFTFEVSNKVQKLKSLEESIQRLSTESYSASKLESKLGYDYLYLKHLAESSFQREDSKELFMGLVEEALVLTGTIYKETNVTPRLTSLAINEDLTESENIVIYENALTHKLEKEFRIPLLQGNLLQENEEAVKTIIKKSVDNGLNDLGEINPGEMATYLPFQNTVKDHVSETLIPDGSMGKIEDFNQAQDSTYDQFDGNAPAVLAKLDKVLDKISTMLAPALFKEKVDMGEDSFDGTKYAMMKAVTDMGEGCEDPSTPCAMSAEAGDTPAASTSDEIIGDDGELAEDAGETEIENEANEIDDAVDAGEITPDEAGELGADEDPFAEIKDDAGEAGEAGEVESAEEKAHEATETPAKEAEEDANEAAGKEEEAGEPADIDEDELAAGIKVELEHTEDEAEATKIATDHLKEDPSYYTDEADAEKQDLDKDGTPDADEPHGLDANSDGDPVDESDKDKSHGVEKGGDAEKEEKEEKEEKSEDSKDSEKESKNPFAKKEEEK